MAHAAPPTPEQLAAHDTPAGRIAVQHAPVTPGKVAMWLFLATEIMFFTGLIGSYIVLRAGSPATAYSNLYPPATNLATLMDKKGVELIELGNDPDKVESIIKTHTGLTDHEIHDLVKHALPHGILYGVSKEKAETLHDELNAAGAKAEVIPLRTASWPLPYVNDMNPLSIDLTAFNTFILICSSVTMVLALSAFQKDQRSKGSMFLLATVLIGSCFLGIQVFEYYQLMIGHHYPPGISSTGHFRPDVSIFGSCFFTMTGFHGMHVFAGVVMLTCIFLRSLTGAYTRTHYSPVELVGLYWHFVDLVWIILFTLVYLI